MKCCSYTISYTNFHIGLCMTNSPHLDIICVAHTLTHKWSIWSYLGSILRPWSISSCMDSISYQSTFFWYVYRFMMSLELPSISKLHDHHIIPIQILNSYYALFNLVVLPLRGKWGITFKTPCGHIVERLPVTWSRWVIFSRLSCFIHHLNWLVAHVASNVLVQKTLPWNMNANLTSEKPKHA